jgi:hypothetical protein
MVRAGRNGVRRLSLWLESVAEIPILRWSKNQAQKPNQKSGILRRRL